MSPLVSRNASRIALIGFAFLWLVLSGCAQEQGDGARSCFDASDCLANQACVQEMCGCSEGYSDCDGDPNNGCESEGECLCPELGVTETCYDGPADTLGVGACIAGEKTCTATGWSECSRQILPVAESCDA